MKLHIYISDPEAYAQGELDFAFSLKQDKEWVDHYHSDWIYVGAIEPAIESLVSLQDVTQKAMETLDERIRETRAQMQERIQSFEERQQNLMALEAPKHA